jgi:hypothetical protein
MKITVDVEKANEKPFVPAETISRYLAPCDDTSDRV